VPWPHDVELHVVGHEIPDYRDAGRKPVPGLCMAVLMGMLAWFFGFCTREVYRGTFPKKAKE